jgi:hypothetical protein
MNSYYGSVNGPSCHYARLARYNQCSLAEVQATAQPSTTDFTYKPATNASSGPAGAPKKEKYEMMDESMKNSTMEGYAMSGADSDYKPSYVVPNYPPINTDSLTHGVGYQCGGYFNILDAYGSNSSSCVTNYITN